MKKSTIRNKLDKICGEIIRAKGKCERCSSREQLQNCHINSRKYNLTRWDLDNLLCLCATCHVHFHDHPLELGDFVKKVKGEQTWENLQEVYKSQTKYTTEDLILKLKVLQDIKSKLMEG